MTRDDVLTRLRAHEAELRAAGIEALDLFGSVASGDAGPDSDVDLACRLDPEAKIGLFQYIGLKHKLEDLLSVEVGLPTMKVFTGRIGDQASRNRVRVFG